MVNSRDINFVKFTSSVLLYHYALWHVLDWLIIYCYKKSHFLTFYKRICLQNLKISLCFSITTKKCAFQLCYILYRQVLGYSRSYHKINWFCIFTQAKPAANGPMVSIHFHKCKRWTENQNSRNLYTDTLPTCNNYYW